MIVTIANANTSTGPAGKSYSAESAIPPMTETALKVMARPVGVICLLFTANAGKIRLAKTT